MAKQVLTDVDAGVLSRLHQRAARHGRTPEAEAKELLSEALRDKGADGWAQADAIYGRLATSGRPFSDSADLLREDRDR
jgi:plasmid stability protein